MSDRIGNSTSSVTRVVVFPQLENLGNFIKAILAYGMKPNDIFEANDLFENGNMTQVQSTLLSLASIVSVIPRGEKDFLNYEYYLDVLKHTRHVMVQLVSPGRKTLTPTVKCYQDILIGFLLSKGLVASIYFHFLISFHRQRPKACTHRVTLV